MSPRFCRQSLVEMDRSINLKADFNRVMFERVLDLTARCVNDFRREGPSSLRRCGRPIDADHFDDVLEETTEPLCLAENHVTVFDTIVRTELQRLHIAVPGFNHREPRHQ